MIIFTNSKILWKALKTLNIKSKQTESIPDKFKNVNNLNDYFASVYSQYNSCKLTAESLKLKKFNDTICFKFRLAEEWEIIKIVTSLKSNAAGYDGITTVMLQYCLPCVALPLTHIVNLCLETGYFPTAWKLSLVKPLPKSNKPAELSDFRPIALIPVLSKILEIFLKPLIYQYAVFNKIIPAHQSGFRQGHNTATVLSYVIDNILNSMDDGEALALILLDFSKAFDTLDHELLCSKLAFYGFSDISLKFFRCYLSDRKQVVQIDDNFSSSNCVTSGVPQGSVLGPILFLIYTADLLQKSSYCNMISYADDTQLLMSFNPNETETAITKITHDLKLISEYSAENNLKLNINKCSLMCFCSARRYESVSSQLKVNLNGTSLNCVKLYKNLGVVFDVDMRFKSHIANILKKSYCVLKSLYMNKYLLNFKIRKKLCESLIFPIIAYCLVSFYNCLDKNSKNRLQKLQNSCCRFVFGLRKYDHISEKINILQWLKIDNMYKYQTCNFTQKIISTKTPSYLFDRFIFRSDVNRTLRYPNKLEFPVYSSSIFRRSYLYNAILLFNNIENNVKKMSLSTFRKKLKEVYMSQQI